jgi:DnaJ-class molecular chaperone
MEQATVLEAKEQKENVYLCPRCLGAQKVGGKICPKCMGTGIVPLKDLNSEMVYD